MADRERIDLPSGATVWYDDATHAYYGHNPKTDRPSRRCTGCTTVAKAFDLDPTNLMRWAAKTQCTGFAERIKMGGGSWTDSGESVWEELVAFNLTYDDVRDQAATKGTNVHELALEALASGQPLPDLDAMTDAERGHAQGVMKFWLDRDPQVEQVEQIVYSERLGVAGRLDLRCRIEGRAGIGVIDLKTGKFISAAAHVQVGGGYPLLAAESGFGDSEWALILQTREDGSYELIEAQATPEDFELAVAVYRAAGRINREARKAREAVAA